MLFKIDKQFARNDIIGVVYLKQWMSPEIATFVVKDIRFLFSLSEAAA